MFYGLSEFLGDQECDLLQLPVQNVNFSAAHLHFFLACFLAETLRVVIFVNFSANQVFKSVGIDLRGLRRLRPVTDSA